MSMKLDWMKQPSYVSSILRLLAEPTAPNGLIMVVQGHPLVWKASLGSACAPARQPLRTAQFQQAASEPSLHRAMTLCPKAPQVGFDIMIGDMGR